MRFRTGRGLSGRLIAAVALSAALVAVIPPTAGAKGGPKFQNGTWNLTLSAQAHWTAAGIQESNLAVGGKGKLEALQGDV